MSNGKNPLMLMMALAMPGAVQAIGLGDIHVESALNERLVAEIDIIGATPLELADLRAAVANRETFVRYGVDRPAFLSSATFKVTQNSQGRPVLAIRSTDTFTEPLVNFLVDLRWHNGEFVREYTLLLDPPNFGSDAPSLAAPAPATAPVTAPAPQAKPTALNKTQTVADAAPAQSDSASTERGAERGTRTTTQITVGAKATLRGIAWRLGERSPSDLQRMMIALFRANPAAFDGNINRLYLGAVLRVPSQQDLESISKDDAHREFHAQMEAWRSTIGSAKTMVAHRVAPTAMPTAAPAATASPTAAPAAAPAMSASAVATVPDQEAKALGHRIESLEQELAAVKSLLDSENHQLENLQQQESNAAKAEHDAKAERGGVQPAASPAVAAGATAAATVTLNSTGAAVAQPVKANPADAPVAESANASADATVKATSADAPVAESAPAQTADAIAKTAPADAPVAAAGKAKFPAAGAAPDEPTSGHGSLAAAAVGLGTLGAALAALYFRLRRRRNGSYAESGDDLGETFIVSENVTRVQPAAAQPTSAPAFETEFMAQAERAPSQQSTAARNSPPADVSLDDKALEAAIEAAAIYESTHSMLPIISDSDATVAIGSLEGDAPASGPSHPSESDATTKLPVDSIVRRGADRRAAPENTRVDTRLDYNLVDLDMTVQHVSMPSALNESPVMKERRTNLADVLKQALEREPNRDDLRMKLLELYFSAATLNRNGFLEVVQKLAQDRPNYRQSDEWKKIAFMGRQILSDNPLFLEELGGDVDLQLVDVEDVRKVS